MGSLNKRIKKQKKIISVREQNCKDRDCYETVVNCKNWATSIRRLIVYELKPLCMPSYIFFKYIAEHAIIANADVYSRFAEPWPVFFSVLRIDNSRFCRNQLLTMNKIEICLSYIGIATTMGKEESHLPTVVILTVRARLSAYPISVMQTSLLTINTILQSIFKYF